MSGRRASTVRRRVEQVSVEGGDPARRERTDTLATEEPLEIRIVRSEDLRGGRIEADAATRVAGTMRTPGGDFELAARFQ